MSLNIVTEIDNRVAVKHVLMSGSGSTVFGLVRTEEEGRAAVAQLEAKGLKAWSVRTACPVV